jgi:hypothetical protein
MMFRRIIATTIAAIGLSSIAAAAPQTAKCTSLQARCAVEVGGLVRSDDWKMELQMSHFGVVCGAFHRLRYARPRAQMNVACFTACAAAALTTSPVPE